MFSQEGDPLSWKECGSPNRI